VTISQLKDAATQSTSYANAPAVSKELGEWTLTPGSALHIATGPCSEIAGKVATYKMSGTESYKLDFFQDYNPCPLGLYIKAY